MLRKGIICLLLVVLTAVVYHSVGNFAFLQYDDAEYITDNEMVQHGLTLDGFFWAFESTLTGIWHPATWLSLMLDCQIFGVNSAASHWINVAFHIADTLLLFFVLTRITGAVWRSAFVSFLFALHPLHVQSVAWVVERKDTLSAFFMFLTLLAYAGYAKEEGKKFKRHDLFFAALIFYSLGLMSKPTLVTVPVLLLLLDFWPLKRFDGVGTFPGLTDCIHSPSFKRLLLEKVPFFLLSAVALCMGLYARAGSVQNKELLPLSTRIINLPAYYTFYLGKMLFPVNLAINYPYQSVPYWWSICSFLLLAAITAFCFWKIRAYPYFFFGWAWFLVGLVPVIGLVQAPGQTLADRYTYLPSIGLFISAAWILGEVASLSVGWRKSITVAAVILILASAIDTGHQLKYWKNNITVFSHSLAVNSDNNSLSYACLAMTEWSEEGDFQSAENYFYEAVKAGQKYQWDSNLRTTRVNLGLLLLSECKPEQAEVQFRAALRNDTNGVAVAYLDKCLGDALSDQGKQADAEAEYSAAVQLSPDGSSVAQEIADSETLLGLLSKLKSAPSAEIHSEIAVIKIRQHRFRDAEAHYLAALALKPNSPEILNDLSWLMASCVDSKVRDGVRAVKYARRACELTNWNQAREMGTLGAAYSADGKYEEAVEMAQRACDLAEKNGESDLVNANKQLMETYRAHQSVRE